MDDEPQADQFGGVPVAVVSLDTGATPGYLQVEQGESWQRLSALDATRLWSLGGVDDRADFLTMLELFVALPGVERVSALDIGYWGEPADEAPYDELAAVADRMPDLTTLHLGEVSDDPSVFDLAGFSHGDITRVVRAFPRLAHLRIWGNGGDGVWLEPGRYGSLRKLEFVECPLSEEEMRPVAASEFPTLEHLELTLAPIGSLAPILASDRIPRLRTLAFRGDEYGETLDADDLLQALADAPVAAELHTLTLTDCAVLERGVEGLLSSGRFQRLKRLNIHDEKPYLRDQDEPLVSEEIRTQLVRGLPDTHIDVTEDE